MHRGWRLDPEPSPNDPLLGRLLTRMDGLIPTSAEVADFVQSWLFFGLLYEVMFMRGVVVDPCLLLLQNGGRIWITFSPLAHLFNVWKQNGEGLSKSLRKEQFRATERLLMTTLAFAVANFTTEWPFANTVIPSSDQRSPVGLEVELSIFHLLEMIQIITRTDRFGPSLFPAEHLLCASLPQYLQTLGWCPSEVSIAKRGFDNTALYFACTLDRVSLNLSHTQCTASRCGARNISNTEYQTKHIDACNGCIFLGINDDDTAIRTLGGIYDSKYFDTGILDHSGKSMDGPRASEAPYVAISHVWSDGLGNERSNTLPRCQLLKLRSYVRKLARDHDVISSYIWIDTLCVPVEDGPAKRHVLQKLVEIYSNAVAILVLDEDLQETDSSASDEEQIMRIVFSGWMRRLWTLEEGMVAQDKLFFQLRDKAVRIHSAYDSPYDGNPPYNVVGRQAYNLFRKSVPPKRVNDVESDSATCPVQDESQWRRTLAAIEYRSTSRVIDETICLSHILGLDVSRLVLTKDKLERMREFISVLGRKGIRLPRKILFTPGPKLPFDGFRWAPASFQDIGGLMNFGLTSLGVDGGLQVKSKYVRRMKFEGLMKSVMFYKEGTVWYVIAPMKDDDTRGRYWTKSVETSYSQWDRPSYIKQSWSSLSSPDPRALYLIPEDIHGGTGVGVLVKASTDQAIDYRVDVEADIILQVNIFELETDGYNLPIDNLNMYEYSMAIPEQTFHCLEKAMGRAFEKCFNAEEFGLASLVFSDLGHDISWIVR